MRLVHRIALAQLPLVVALAVTIATGSVVTRALADDADAILRDNYRSVLAAQRMKDAAQRLDRGLALAALGDPARDGAELAAVVARFEDELRTQEGNITEAGERDATRALRAAWARYRADVVAARTTPPTARRYADALVGELVAVQDAADAVLALNQDAMIRKSDRARQLASTWRARQLAISLAGLALGLLASAVITARVLRPLGVLGQTARRLGEGDVAVRAQVERNDEIGALARELNTMAERIHRYRQSSLGELLEAQAAAQAAIDSLPDPVLVIAADGELRQVNAAAERLLGARVDGAPAGLGRLAPGLRGAVERVRAHVLAGHGEYVPKGLDEAVAIAADPGERLVLPRAAPLYAEQGAVVGATVVLQDVTRLRRFEELQDDLVATVAHELRTPLTSLRMAVHLLAERAVGELSARQDDLVFAAREDCDRLQAIVDELLDLSRIAAHRIELRTAAHDPEALVRAAIDAQRAAAAAREVEVVAELLPGTPAVEIDRERVLLVLSNLIGNAIRYGPARGRVAIRATVDGDRLRFEVRDQGPGVPPAYRLAVFDKYVRVPGAPAGGAGLGLYIAREIVRAHGGDIGIADLAEPGATFWFTVPLAAGPAVEAA